MASDHGHPPEQIEAWAEEAPNHDAREWANEEARWSKALYVGNHSEKDRRSIHGESARGVKAARRFWESVPQEHRLAVAREAGLSRTAIPEDLL